MSFLDPSSWGDPFVDLYDKGKSVVDKATDVARDAIAVAEVLGEGIVDAAETVGDGLVTAGEGVAKWSVTATGEAIDWSQTSYAEVAEWTEHAAGDVAGFSVSAFNEARSALETGAKWVWEQIAAYFYETLPRLGGIDPQARDAASYLLSEPVARGMESLCGAAGCVISFGIKLKALSSVNLGLYVCGDGWGFFFDSRFGSFQEMIANPSLSLGVSAQATMVFGPVSRASGARAVKLGIGLKSHPKAKLAATIGGVILMEASMPPLFLGIRYMMDLDLDLFGKKKTVDEAGKLKWKVSAAVPKPNGDFATDAYGLAELGWQELTAGLSAQAPNFEAALRAQADPASAERIQATALASSIAAFAPRYYGTVRTLKGQTVVGTSQGAIGLELAGDRRTVQIVMGLSDPTGVSFEAVGEPPLYWCAGADGVMKLVPYDSTSPDFTGTTFRMIRGLAGQGASFAVAADGKDNPRFLVATQMRSGVVTLTPLFCAERLLGSEGPTSQDATFLLDRPLDPPEAATPILRPGQFLRVGEAKRSANGRFSLLLAANGRLVMRTRSSGSLNSPTAWLAYEPGLIQDEKLLWAWASPPPLPASAYHAIVTHDGRLAVRAGADPTQAGATLWQSERIGEPGPCFMAVTNQGVVTLMRGSPDAPGETVWNSVDGAIYWPLKRQYVALKAPSGYVSAGNGGGVNTPEALTQAPAEWLNAIGQGVAAWETFELQELCDGNIALRAQGRRFVGVQDAGYLISLRDQVGPRERFTRDVVSGCNGQPTQIRLKSVHTGKYIAAAALPALGASAELGGAAILDLIEFEHNFTAHAGRLVHIVAKHSGKALEVADGRQDNGLGLTQGRFHGGDHQKWILTDMGGGWFSLTNHHTGRCVDINHSQLTIGATALQWPASGGPNQSFHLLPLGDGSYAMIARHSGLRLEVSQASQSIGAPIVQAPVGGGAHQRWIISLASSAKKAPDAFKPVLVTDLAALMKLEVVRLKSWKGDYLRRNDVGGGVTSSPGGDTWRVALSNGKLALLSTKNDYLHRPDGPSRVTTWALTIGSEWTLELRGSKVLLRSWKGDYLHRPDSPSGVTTWSATIGSEWTIEALLP